MIRKSMPSDLIRGWVPVFPRDKREAFARRSCSNKKIDRDDDSKKSHPALTEKSQIDPSRSPPTNDGKGESTDEKPWNAISWSCPGRDVRVRRGMAVASRLE